MKTHQFKLLLLTLFVQFFYLQPAKFNQQEHVCIDSFHASKKYPYITQEEDGEKIQQRRIGRSPSPNSHLETFSRSDVQYFVSKFTDVSTFINPVASSYQGSKREVLNARPHPPTISLLF